MLLIHCINSTLNKIVYRKRRKQRRKLSNLCIQPLPIIPWRVKQTRPHVGLPLVLIYAERAKNGENIIALSQDLILGSRGAYCRENCPFAYGEVVIVRSDNKIATSGEQSFSIPCTRDIRIWLIYFSLIPTKTQNVLLRLKKYNF